MTACSKPGCNARTFMDSDRCFDHQRTPGGALFGAWFIFVALIALALLGVGVWAVIEVVSWLTSK